LPKLVHRNAVLSLIFARVIYAVNWYNIGSVFSLIALDFGQNVGGLGIVTGSFYLGLGLGQVPGGIIAAKIGPRRTSVLGTISASSACLLSSLTTEFYQIAILRLIAGLGMAFVFAPGVTLIARYFGRTFEGLGVGVFNAVFYLGGAVGLFGWAVFASISGWRLSLLTSGGIGLVTGLVMLILLPKDNLKEEFSIKRSALIKVLSDKSLILLGMELFGITGGASVVTAIMIYYMEDFLKASPSLAGLVVGLSPVFALIASPLAGRTFDRNKNAFTLIFLSGTAMSVGLALASITTLYGSLLSSLIVGFCSGAGTTVGFSAAREWNKAGDEYETLAVGWVNSLQLYSGFLSPIIFSFVAIHSGYIVAWLIAGLLTFVFVSSVVIRRWFRFSSAGDRTHPQRSL
jgi:MFS family permease